MKKAWPYMLGTLALLGGILWWWSRPPGPRRPDERITLRAGDRIPYGCYLFRQMLPGLYPATTVFTEPGPPGEWAGLQADEGGQVVILPALDPEPTVSDWNALFSFARKGNTVLLITARLPAYAQSQLGISVATTWRGVQRDSQQYTLRQPPSSTPGPFPFYGPRYYGSLKAAEHPGLRILARNGAGAPQFVAWRFGRGRVLLHLAPLAFSNYFLLQGNNRRYAEAVVSHLPRRPTRVAWSEYLLEQPRTGNEQKGAPDFFGVLLRYRAFRLAAWTAGIALLLFALLGWRRRQRPLPPHHPPADRTADYLRTVGNLYYRQREDAALAQKMAHHFISAMRDRYSLLHPFPSPDFTRSLQARSGYPAGQLNALLGQTEAVLYGGGASSGEDLKHYYIELQAFYGHEHRNRPHHA